MMLKLRNYIEFSWRYILNSTLRIIVLANYWNLELKIKTQRVRFIELI